jgi:hypothetical protein
MEVGVDGHAFRAVEFVDEGVGARPVAVLVPPKRGKRCGQVVGRLSGCQGCVKFVWRHFVRASTRVSDKALTSMAQAVQKNDSAQLTFTMATVIAESIFRL